MTTPRCWSRRSGRGHHVRTNASRTTTRARARAAAIAARIIAALRAHAGADVAITPETLAPLDHLHGRGAQATEELVTLLEPRAGEAILDIGSGLGGPGAMDRGAVRLHDDRRRPHRGALRRGARAQCRLRPVGPGADHAGQRARPAAAGRRLRPGVFAQRGDEHRRQGDGVSRGVPRAEAGRAAGAVARQCRAERSGRALPGGLGVGAGEQLPRDA